MTAETTLLSSRIAFWALFLASIAAPLNAAENSDPYPGEPLQPGDTIPAGSLETPDGEAFPLREKVAEKPAVLIFYRGSWCPFCTRHLAALADIVPDLEQAGFQLLAISPDRPAVSADNQDLPYTLLSDSSMELTRRFGIAFKVEDALVNKYKTDYKIDLEADSGETHHLLPHPAVFVVDTGGVIRFAYVNEDYKVRLEPGKVLEAVRKIGDESG